MAAHAEGLWGAAYVLVQHQEYGQIYLNYQDVVNACYAQTVVSLTGPTVMLKHQSCFVVVANANLEHLYMQDYN